MRCPECGADPPGAETCLERFWALLAAEVENRELAQMHGLTVLTYHVQHPSRTKPWYPPFGYAVLRRAFAQGEDWLAVLMERRRYPDRITQMKAAAGPTMPPEYVTGPVAGELTVATVDPTAPAGQSATVLAWARSVAEGRVRARSRAAAETRVLAPPAPPPASGRRARRARR